MNYVKMPRFTESIVRYYDLLFIDLADKRSNKLFLMRSPFPILSILIAYVYFVTYFGPKMMKNKRPFKLETLMKCYNLIQIVLNGFIFVEALRHAWAGKYNWLCEPINQTDNEEQSLIIRTVHCYFLIKVVDLFDTIFMVLRKQISHISFLHVYHHTGMCILAWSGTKFLPGGHGTFLGLVNSFVHMAMYSYYLTTTLYPRYKRRIWWKKYLTQLQMLQFLLVALHSALLLLQPNCEYPKFVVYVVVPQNVFMLALFSDFYYKAYLKPQNNKIVNNNNNDEKWTTNGYAVLTNGCLPNDAAKLQ